MQHDVLFMLQKKKKRGMLGHFASAYRKKKQRKRKKKAKKKEKEKTASGNFRNCGRQFWKRQMSGQRC